jgi:hypothetical protein
VPLAGSVHAAGGDLDEPVRGFPGMESYLRRRDLPRQCRRISETVDVDPMLHLLATGTAHNVNARALILNTAATLEGSAVTNIARLTRDVLYTRCRRRWLQPVARGRRVHGMARRPRRPVRSVRELGKPRRDLPRAVHGVPVWPCHRRVMKAIYIGFTAG